MCGIFGHSTNTPRKINQSNVKILGMFNETRGKNSCGITFDGEIYHGIDDTKLFTDFMKGQNFIAKSSPLMFGHTRQSSVGTVNEFNCHPFGFGESKSGEGYKFIGVHNGTLLNYEELAKKYEVDITEEYIDNDGDTRIRRKIDSEIMLEIIYKTKNLKVLSDYNGKAALVWTDTDNPEVVYLWSGKSKPYASSADNLAEEERPLIVYVENKNSFYFSSLKESLYAIGGNTKNVFQIEYNTVYIVKNGDFRSAKTFRVSRKNNFNTDSWGKTCGYGANSSVVNNPDHLGAKVRRLAAVKEYAERKKLQEGTTPLLIEATTTMSSINNIYRDKTLYDQSVYGKKTYTKGFRYYRNGHLLEGIYIYVNGYGFYDMGKTEKEAQSTYEVCVGEEFVKELDDFDFSGEYRGKGKVIWEDFNSPPMYWYIMEGVLLKNKLDYEVLKADKVARNKDTAPYFDYHKLSYLSIQPVIDIRQPSKADKHQEIYKEGRLFTGQVDGLLFEKRYNVQRGNLIGVIYKEQVKLSSSIIGITKTGEEKQIQIALPFNKKVMDLSESFIENMEHSILHTESQDVEFEEEDNWQEKHELDRSKTTDEKFFESLEETDKDMKEAQEKDQDQIVDEKLNEYLTEPLVSFQNCRQELEFYKGNSKAKEAILLLDNLVGFLEEYLRKTEKR